MIYLANFHTDVRIDINTKYQILVQGKIISTGYYHNYENRPLNTTRKMNSGDDIVIRLLSFTNAKNNPNAPYLIKTKVDEISSYTINSIDMQRHKNILLP